MLGHRKFEVEDYLAILKRRKWWILIPTVLLSILAGIATFVIPSQYLSQTLVLIDQQKVPDEYVKPVVSSDLDSRLASMKEQILSRSRLSPIIERYNLYGNQHISLDDKVDIARKNIAINAIRSQITHAGGLPGFFISFTANDPRTAQQVCGEITTMFVNQNLKSREDMTEGTTDFLKGQLADAKRSLDDQDSKLAAFQRTYVGKLPGEASPNVNMLTSLNTQLEAVNQDVSRLEQNKSYGESMLAQVSPMSSSGVAAEIMVPNPQREVKQAELTALQNQETELLAHYTPDYPDVIAIKRRVAEATKTLASTPATIGANSPGVSGSASTRADSASVLQLKAQLRAADMGLQSKRREQSMLQGQISMYQERISSSPLVEQQYKQLTRDYDTAKQFYDDLLTKMNHSKVATALETQMQGEQFHVMDQPNLPEAPIFPKRGIFFAGGFLGGLALGCLLAAFLEYRDTSIRSDRDVWAFTKLPTLATITLGSEALMAPSPAPNSDTPNKPARRWGRRKSSPAPVPVAGS